MLAEQVGLITNLPLEAAERVHKLTTEGMLAGSRPAEIAEQIGVSATTVKTHFDNIYCRLGVSDRCAAVATALRHGLID